MNTRYLGNIGNMPKTKFIKFSWQPKRSEERNNVQVKCGKSSEFRPILREHRQIKLHKPYSLLSYQIEQMKLDSETHQKNGMNTCNFNPISFHMNFRAMPTNSNHSLSSSYQISLRIKLKWIKACIIPKGILIKCT